MAGHKGYVISFMMDVLAGVLTGSRFGSHIAGPYEPDRPSGCGHLLLTIDIDWIMPRAEFEQRMEALIAEIKAVPAADGVEAIFFPGELEALHAERCHHQGIRIADRTWQSLARLSTEARVPFPVAVDA